MVARRFLVATVLTALLFAATATAIGAANGSRAQGTTVTTVELPLPLIGDRASYAWEETGQDNGTGEWQVGWERGSTLTMPDGSTWQTDRFAVQRFPDGLLHNTSLQSIYGQGSHSLLGFSLGMQDTTSAESDLFGYPVRTRQDAAGGLQWLVFVGEGGIEQPSCLFSGVLGGQLRSDRGVRLAGCSEIVLRWSNGDLRPVGVELVAEVPALRFHAESTRSTMDLWFASGIPYPVQVVHADEYGRTALTMTSFLPGTQARGSAVEPGQRQDPKPGLDWFPRSGPLLVEDAGLDHPFPLSQAFRIARGDDEDPGLRDFMQAHADAVVAGAWLMPYDVSDAAVGWEWTFQVVGGNESLDVWVERMLPKAAMQLPRSLQEPFARHSTASMAGHPPSRRLDLPENVPTAASLLSRAAWYQGSATARGECYGYGFGIVDGYAAGRCGTRIDIVLPQASLGSTSSSAALQMNWTGADRAFLDEWQTNAFGPAATAGGAPVTEKAATPREQAVFVAQAPLDAFDVTRAGALALVVGALYYFWPVLKSALIAPLFSRLRPDRLSDHPRRAQILAEVARSPGIHFKELLRRTGMTNGGLTHHLGVLERGGRLQAHRAAGHTCLFLASTPATALLETQATRSAGAQSIMAVVKRHPGLSMEQVAQRCGLRASTVTYHARRLRDAGVLDIRRDGHALRLHPG